MVKYAKGLLIAAAAAALTAGLSATASAQQWQHGGLVRTQAVVVVTPGWHGDRYYDGHRYWERREWERHHREEAYRHDHRYDAHRY